VGEAKLAATVSPPRSEIEATTRRWARRSGRSRAGSRQDRDWPRPAGAARWPTAEARSVRSSSLWRGAAPPPAPACAADRLRGSRGRPAPRRPPRPPAICGRRARRSRAGQELPSCDRIADRTRDGGPLPRRGSPPDLAPTRGLMTPVAVTTRSRSRRTTRAVSACAEDPRAAAPSASGGGPPGRGRRRSGR